jgi:hypothetical protein
MTSWEHGVKFSAQIKMQALLEPAIAPTVFTGLALLVIGHLGYWPLLMTVFNRTWENLWSTDRIQSDLRAKQVEKRGTLVAQQKKFLENGEDLKDIEDQLLQLDFWLAKDFFTNLHPRRDLDFIYQNLDELNEAVTACLQVFRFSEPRISKVNEPYLGKGLTGTTAPGMRRPKTSSPNVRRPFSWPTRILTCIR